MVLLPLFLVEEVDGVLWHLEALDGEHEWLAVINTMSCGSVNTEL